MHVVGSEKGVASDWELHGVELRNGLARFSSGALDISRIERERLSASGGCGKWERHTDPLRSREPPEVLSASDTSLVSVIQPLVRCWRAASGGHAHIRIGM